VEANIPLTIVSSSACGQRAQRQHHAIACWPGTLTLTFSQN